MPDMTFNTSPCLQSQHSAVFFRPIYGLFT